MSTVTVGVASLCGAAKVDECLRALAGQRGAPAFDVVVAHDPDFPGLPGLRERFPAVRFVAREGCRTPIDLMALALTEATGDVFLLTEDHCIPSPDWVRRLCEELQPGRAAVGGGIEAPGRASPVAWAFYFLDFFPYLGPLQAGPTPSLSVCNVGYRRADLVSIRSHWLNGFHETLVHGQLCSTRGPLWMVPDAVVTMTRHVSLAGAVREAYGQGRLFASKRVERTGALRRLKFLTLAPALPMVLFLRRAMKAASQRASARRFLRALPWIGVLILAWSWGEWLGYLTGRPPSRLVLARDVGAAP